MAIPIAVSSPPAYDFFISHAGADKDKYITPIVQSMTRAGLSLWIDNLEIAWGDNVSTRLSQGLRESRFVLLCLSKHFIERPWPETELGAALALQNSSGLKRVLPLILNSTTEVLDRYPIIGGFSYREFRGDADKVAEELASLVARAPGRQDQKVVSTQALYLSVESAHAGQISQITASSRASLRWLADRAKEALGVRAQADTGAYVPFSVRWVLVDSKADEVWKSLSRSEQARLYAVIMSEAGLRFSYSDLQRLDEAGIYNEAVFHLYAVEELSEPPPAAKQGF